MVLIVLKLLKVYISKYVFGVFRPCNDYLKINEMESQTGRVKEMK